MFYLSEFERWRAAPLDQREAVARQQFEAHHVDNLFPSDDPTEILTMPAGNGKAFADSTSDELELWMEWFLALREASRRFNASMTLQLEISGLRI